MLFKGSLFKYGKFCQKIVKKRDFNLDFIDFFEKIEHLEFKEKELITLKEKNLIERNIEKILLNPPKNEELDTLNNIERGIVRQKMINKTSRFIGFCLRNEFFDKNYSKICEKLLIHLIFNADIVNRKNAVYFNHKLVIYVLQNPFYDKFFKIQIFERAIKNFSAFGLAKSFKFANFILKQIFLKEITPKHKDNELIYSILINPQDLFEKIFKVLDSSPKISENELLIILQNSHFLSLEQRLEIIELALAQTKENKKELTLDLLEILKELKELPFHSQIIDNFIIKLTFRLTSRFKDSNPEIFYSFPEYFLKLLLFLKSNGGHINENNFFKEIFRITFASMKMNPYLQQECFKILLGFVEFMPDFVKENFKEYLEKMILENKIGFNEVMTIFKIVMDDHLKGKERNFVYLSFLKKFLSSKESVNYICWRFEELIEFVFYTNVIDEFGIISIEENVKQEMENLVFRNIENIEIELREPKSLMILEAIFKYYCTSGKDESNKNDLTIKVIERFVQNKIKYSDNLLSFLKTIKRVHKVFKQKNKITESSSFEKDTTFHSSFLEIKNKENISQTFLFYHPIYNSYITHQILLRVHQKHYPTVNLINITNLFNKTKSSNK